MNTGRDDHRLRRKKKRTHPTDNDGNKKDPSKRKATRSDENSPRDPSSSVSMAISRPELTNQNISDALSYQQQQLQGLLQDLQRSSLPQQTQQNEADASENNLMNIDPRMLLDASTDVASFAASLTPELSQNLGVQALVDLDRRNQTVQMVIEQFQRRQQELDQQFQEVTAFLESQKRAAEVHQRSRDLSNLQEGSVVVPCRARGMPKNHNAKVRRNHIKKFYYYGLSHTSSS